LLWFLSDIEHFKRGREASACLGATPVQHSSGGKVNISSISKTSVHKKLRAVLYQGAFSVVNKVKTREPKTVKEVWIKALLARKPLKVVTVALINKTIRTAYAILKNKTEYNATLLSGNIA
jgi:transposase